MDAIEYVVFDLDKTLVYCENDSDGEHILNFADGSSFKCAVRPGFNELLTYVKRTMRAVFVWSAGSKEYVDKVVEDLFPYKPDMVWSVDMCEKKKDIKDEVYPYVKPLEKIYFHAGKIFPQSWNVEYLYRKDSPFPNMYNTVIIDDNPDIGEENRHNQILVKEYLGGREDRDLYRVMNLLSGRPKRSYLSVQG